MIVAVLQARMSSRRLPGKVAKPILNAPMLARQIERLQRCRRLDALIVATSVDHCDDTVKDIALASQVACHRGSLDDVLDRFYSAALPYAPDYVVRLTGDCPLADSEVIDRVIDFTCEGGFDYGSNTLRPTWPDGLDVEVISFPTLEIAWHEAASSLDREHVGPFITSSPARFRLGNLENDEDLSGLRWTVDEKRDLEFVRRVYEALYPINPAFTTTEILAFLKLNPEIVAINADIQRNQGFTEAWNRLAKHVP
jgi:spore coat polysaccharide biosynthesis protein SpsF